ncbi:MAG: hypothetical protein A2V98_20745 [Planctomycetes bacterium RBG_16_64_12]|nr:MAG: hypothetical protein A2V98_20745 [Planctomycetes bacterium RBG_16_64_12]
MWAAEPKRPLKVAAILTAFFYRSHAHVILENFLVPYLFNAKVVDPRKAFQIASFYVDQFPPDGDMARATAEQFHIPIYDSITEAICLGGDKLAVDAVLLICEHGEYPLNEKGQTLYPKKAFFDEIVSVFKTSGRVVPLYNDKHLSHTWPEAKEMVDTSREMGFGLMAGSSVPLAQRIPKVELTRGAKIEEAVSIHGGPLESYGFHGLEVLESMLETRASGETGISEVRYVEGDALWQTAEQGLWSAELARAAMAAELGEGLPPPKTLVAERFPEAEPHAFLLGYRDGTRAAVLKLGSTGIRWNFACRVAGKPEPLATRFHVGPWQNRNLFKALAHAIQAHFLHNQSPYPVERTLLASGALEAAIDSHVGRGKVVKTPHLEWAYAPQDFSAYREMGATWQIITEEVQQPAGIAPVGINPTDRK